jgi:hypothetical protein
MPDVPQSALAFGFVNGPGGTHTSRTIMLAELRLLLAACPASASFSQYRQAAVDENALLKTTQSTRARSLKALRELYSLDRKVTLFRVLRELWLADADAQPLIALACAAARDPLLRETVDFVLSLPQGQAVTPQVFCALVQSSRPDQYNGRTLASVGRNLISSWQQSGHLSGKVKKTRSQAQCRPAAVVYALLLGYLCGARGEALFDTLWVRLLDAPTHTLHNQAFQASAQGWLEYRHTGMVTEIGFRHLLGPSAGEQQ